MNSRTYKILSIINRPQVNVWFEQHWRPGGVRVRRAEGGGGSEEERGEGVEGRGDVGWGGGEDGEEEGEVGRQ